MEVSYILHEGWQIYQIGFQKQHFQFQSLVFQCGTTGNCLYLPGMKPGNSFPNCVGLPPCSGTLAVFLPQLNGGRSSETEARTCPTMRQVDLVGWSRGSAADYSEEGMLNAVSTAAPPPPPQSHSGQCHSPKWLQAGGATYTVCCCGCHTFRIASPVKLLHLMFHFGQKKM